MPDLDVAIPSRLAGDGPWPSSGDGRAIVRRRSLPGSRAVIGGFLIAAAAVITFGAYTGATRPSRQMYVVAALPLAPGARITAPDLRLVALDLPDPAVRRQVFGSVDELVGASVLAPIAPGSLVEADEVVGRGGAPGTREISVSIDELARLERAAAGP